MKSEAFDLKESALTGAHADIRTYDNLAVWLSQELEQAQAGRSSIEGEMRYWWKLVEQQRTRSTLPWPNAADLTSPLARIALDGFQARLMQTIFVEPMWTVEGWGASAKRAPFVEEFHQRTMEEERLQSYMDEVTQNALVEGVGILRVSEGHEYRRERKRLRAKWAKDAEGNPIMGEDLQPKVELDQMGNPVPAADGDLASIDGEWDMLEPVRLGPHYDVVPYLDQVLLPGHARTRTQVWGEGFRFFRRVPELQALAKRGIYDKDAVEELGETNDKANDARDVPNTATVVTQQGPTAQQELWEVSFLADLDGTGERWWLATVSAIRYKLLRLKVNDRTTRTFRFTPFPRSRQIDRGYSLIGEIARTVIEEDTAVRNMRADKAAVSIGAPITKRAGSLWDENEVPWGPHAVIPVRDHDEVRQLQVSDVPQSINIWRSDIQRDADRLFGLNDTALGVDSGESNTLGEERMRASYVEIRMDLIIKRLKEPLEELWHARHEIWKRTLRESETLPATLQRALTGVSAHAQESVMGMTSEGVPFSSVNDGKTVAAMLEGTFWGKPRGSIDTSDIGKQRNDIVALLNVLPNMSKWNPMLAAILQTPQASKSLIEQVLRVFKWPDKQSFLGSDADAVIEAHTGQADFQRSPQGQLMAALAAAGPQQPGMPPQGAPQQGMPMPQGMPPAAPPMAGAMEPGAQQLPQGQ